MHLAEFPFGALILPFLQSPVVNFSRIKEITSIGNFNSWYVFKTSCLFSVPFFCYLIDHSTPASQSPHSSNPSSLPSSPPTHNHNSVPFSNFGPIGTPDNRDRRAADRWKTDKPGETQTSLHSRGETAACLSPAFGIWHWWNTLNFSHLFSSPSHGWVWHWLSLSDIILWEWLASDQHSERHLDRPRPLRRGFLHSPHGKPEGECISAAGTPEVSLLSFTPMAGFAPQHLRLDCFIAHA